MNLPQWLLAALEMMQADPSDVTVTDVINAIDIDARHFTRQFRRYFDCTPGHYLRRLRVEQARELLAHSAMPLAEIAIRSGFADQSHLTRVFKRETGLTPAMARHHSITPS